MTNKKYEFTGEWKYINSVVPKKRIKVYRIKRLSDNKLGGFIEKEDNLSHEGKCWVSDESIVFGNATISEDAIVMCHSVVHGNAKIFGNASVSIESIVFGNVRMSGNSRVWYNAIIGYDIRKDVDGDIEISGNAWIDGRAKISDYWPI